jgi:hypothetical protein
LIKRPIFSSRSALDPIKKASIGPVLAAVKVYVAGLIVPGFGYGITPADATLANARLAERAVKPRIPKLRVELWK